MPRLSLYRPEKGNDFRFLDRVINEQFQVGGTDIYVHKYIGTGTPAEGQASPSTPNNSGLNVPEVGIQDLLFMENRDRKYDPDVYVMRGIYQMQDLDFNLSQFGLFLANDNIMMHFHLRGCVDTIQRKIMPGDVLELPHLKDEYALDDSLVALKRFYVVTDVSRPTNGFSQTWYPHLLRAKCQPLVDTQEFAQILDQDSGAGDGSTLRDLMSTYNKSIEINNQIVEQANQDAPLSGYDKTHFFVIPTRETDGLVDYAAASDGSDDASMDSSVQMDASFVLNTPKHKYYVAVDSGNGRPANGAEFGSGIQFPSTPANGEFYLRTDYLPNALFRYDGKRWNLYEQGVRMTMNQFGAQDVAKDPWQGYQIRQTQKTSFINNTTTATINGKVIEERQALSKVLKPQADN